MKCSECNEKMYHLLESNDDTLAAELKKHISGCSDCHAEYELMMAVVSALKPQQEIKAPASIRQDILKKMNFPEEQAKSGKLFSLRISWKKIAVAAAIISAIFLSPLLFRKSSNAAKAAELISIAIDAGKNIQNFVMQFSVRTSPAEDFDYINTDSPMVSHTVSRSFENPDAWNIWKPGREIIFDGENQYLYIPSMKAAYAGNEHAGFASWMRLLLDPESILWKEKENAEAGNATVKLFRLNADTCMMITTKNSENFMDYQLSNESIRTTSSRREYTFDGKTHLLKGLKIYALFHNKEILILSVDKIVYNTTINQSAFSFILPAGTELKKVNDSLPKLNGTYNMSSKEAAHIALKDLSKGDFSTHPALWSQYNNFMLKLLYKNYQGMSIVRIGEPFTSMAVTGEVVPYQVKFPGGYIKKFRMVLTKSSATGSWVVKGGL